MRLVPLLASLLLCMPTPLLAQRSPAASPHGIVLGASAERVAGARVVLERDGRVVASVTTDAAGRFRFAIVPVAADVIRAEARGHRALTRVVATEAAGAAMVLRMQPDVLELAPLTVIGAPTATIERVPGSSHVVTNAALARQRPLAAHEALRHATGVHVQEEDPLGVNLNIGVRGLNPRRSARVLLLEDGVPILLGPYGDPTAHYQPPVDALRRIEVVKGSGQVAHGPQTVGGVINFVRATPPERTGGSVSLSAGDHGRTTGHLRAGGRLGAHAALLTLDRRTSDGARRGWHHRVEDAQAQLLLRPDARHSLLLRGGWYAENSRFGETGLTQAEFETDPFANPTPNDTFVLERLAAHALLMRELAGDGALTTVLYAQDIDRTSWRQASSSSDRFGSERYAERFGCAPAATTIEACGFQGRPRRYRFAGVEPRLRMPLAARNVLLHLDAGTRMHVESAERRQYLSPGRATAGGELTRDNQLFTTAVSAFAQLDIERGDWRLTPGARLEHVRSSNRNRIRAIENRDVYTRWLPGLGLAFTGFEATTLFAGAHRGFAPPRPADVLEPEAGQSIVQVEPEVSWNYEVGVRSALLPSVLLEATWFRIDFSNQIVEGSLAGANQRFVNAGATLHQGVELAAELATSAAVLRPIGRVTATWLPDAMFASDERSTIDDEIVIRGHRVPYAPRLLLSAAAGFGVAAGPEVVLHGYHVGEQFSDDLNTREPTADGQRGVLPAYTVFDLTLRQHVRRANASVFVRVQNLTNAVYITERQEGIIVGVPRRFAAGVDWQF